MKKAKIILSTIGVLIGIGACLGIVGFKNIEKNLSQLSGLRITNVELSKALDGTYTGKYEAFPVAAEVKVTIKNQKIAGIELIKHNNGKGGAAEVIPGMVIKAQTLEVDTVSGATYSSKVILKAIEDALKSAVK